MNWIIRCLSLLLMVAAASASFMTQRGLFLSWQVDSYSAVVAPLAVDALAILCTLALHMPERSKGVPVTVLILTGGASIAANWIAGATVGAKAVHAGLVGLYLLAEWVASQKEKKSVAVAQAVQVPVQTEAVARVEQATAPEPATAKEPAAEVPQAPKPRRKAAGRYHPVETVSASA